jgi:ATP-dependent Clp protease adaptor protein ClpS
MRETTMTTDTYDGAVETKTTKKTKLKEPPLYKVIYVNDDTTSMDFVVESLLQVFDYSQEAAVALTEQIHIEGYGIAGIYPFEVAEQKGIEVTQAARKQGFPLAIKLEPTTND